MSHVPYLVAAALLEILVFGWAIWVAYRESRQTR